jgi:hypothetical protein
MLEVPFPRYFLHFESLNCLLFPIHYFASPLYRFQDLLFHFFTRIKSSYKCVFSASGPGEITIRGGRA